MAPSLYGVLSGDILARMGADGRGWARMFLRRGGAQENSARGIWALTDLGEKFVSRDQAVEIHAQVNEEERIWAREQRLKEKRAEKAGETVPTECDQSEVADDTLTD